MAIFYLDVRLIGGKSCRSAVGAAAYRAGVKLRNEHDGITHDYTKRRGAIGAGAYRSGEKSKDGDIEHDFTRKIGIVYSEIMLPKHALEDYKVRSTLWNAAQKAERNYNARTAREIVVALPNELTTEQHIKLIQDYVQKNFVDDGMCADFSIHSGHIYEKKDETYPFQDLAVRKDNPHVHIQLTVRPLNKDGTWGEKSKKEYILDKNGDRIKLPSGNWKSRKIELTDWDKVETLLKWRENWAETVNREFERLGIDERIPYKFYQVNPRHLGNLTLPIALFPACTSLCSLQESNLRRRVFYTNEPNLLVRAHLTRRYVQTRLGLTFLPCIHKRFVLFLQLYICSCVA